MAQEITLPVKLQLENLQSIVKDMRSQLGNLKVDSSGYKKLEGVINGIEKKIQDIQVVASRPIMNEKQFASIEKDISSIFDSVTKLGITASGIKFSDLQLTGEQKQRLQEFDNQLKTIKDSMQNVKEAAKSAFLDSDIGKSWVSSGHADAAGQSFQQLTKTIQREVQAQQKLLKEAEQEYNNYQSRMAAQKNLNNFITKKGNLKDTSVMAAEEYNKIFLPNGNFKGGDTGRNLLQKWMEEQFNLDPTFIRGLISKGGQTVQKSFMDMESDVMKMIRSKRNEMGKNLNQESATTRNGATYAEEVTRRQANLEQATTVQKALSDREKDQIANQNVLQQQYEKTSQSLELYKASLVAAAQSALKMDAPTQKMKAELDSLSQVVAKGQERLAKLDKASSKLQGITSFVNRYIGAYAIIRKVSQAIRNAFNNIKELDKVITNIAVVTNMTQEQLWGKVGEYTQIAQEYGVMTKDVYTVSQLFYQQGLQTNQVMELTTETLKMAKIAGMDYTAATNAMTVAVRAFNIEMSEAQQVTDTYSALAAKFAVSSAEIANAMEKTASSAANVGMSLQSTSAFMSVMIQTTRESAQNIGSALKSIISRYGEMKASPSSLINVDGEEVAFNKVDTALKSIGISIQDASGQFRDFDDVIMELAAKWDTLDNNTQRYIATVMAGNRQQSRFIALVSNYDELSRAMTTANNAENASIVQVAKTMDSLESKTNQMKNAWQQLYLSLNIEGGLKRAYDFITRILSTFSKLGTGGTIKSLVSIFGLGTGLKSGIGMLQGRLKRIRGEVDVNTTQAQSKIEELNAKIAERREMVIDTVVNDAQLRDTETRIQQAATMSIQAGIGGVQGSAAALMMNSSSKQFTQQEMVGILARAQAGGMLNTPESREKFLGHYGINKDNADYSAIDNLLKSFNTLASGAETASDQVKKLGQDASTSGDQTKQSSGEVSQAEREKSNAVREATVAEEEAIPPKQEEAAAAEQAAQGLGRVSNGALTEEMARRGLIDAERTGEIQEKLKAAGLVDSTLALKRNTAAEQEEEGASRRVANAKNGEAGAVSNKTGLSLTQWGTGNAMKYASIATMVGRLVGGGFTVAGAQMQDKSTDTIEKSKLVTGIGTGVSGAATGASMGMMLGPWGAIVGAIGGFLIGGLGTILDGLTMTLQERVALAQAEAKKASEEALKKQAKEQDLSSSIDNLRTLRKVMNNSEEDMKKYIDAMNTLGKEYPALISTYDNAGNAVVDLQSAEELLLKTRLDASEAARDAAIAESNVRYDIYEGWDQLVNTAQVLRVGAGPQYVGDKPISTQSAFFKTDNGKTVAVDTTANTGNTPTNFVKLISNILDRTEYDRLKELNSNIPAYEELQEYTLEQWIDFIKDNKRFLKENTNTQAYTVELTSIEEWDRIVLNSVYDSDSAYAMEQAADSVAVLNDEMKALATTLGLQEYQGRENGYVRYLLGRDDDDPLTAEDYQLAQILLQRKRDAYKNSMITLDKQVGLSEGKVSVQSYLNTQPNSELALTIADTSVSGRLAGAAMQAQFEANTPMFNKYHTLAEWQRTKVKEDKAAYDQIKTDAGQIIGQWLYNLGETKVKNLDTILNSATSYRNMDDLLQALGYQSEEELREILINDFNLTEEYADIIINSVSSIFEESIQAQKDRINRVIYGVDEKTGKIKTEGDLAKSLTGFEKLSADDEEKAKKIAHLITDNEIISKYADFFADQIIEINKLADNGYTTLASRRLEFLSRLSDSLQSIDNWEDQDALFGIITNIDFTDFSSIQDAKKKIETYRSSHHLSQDQIDKLNEIDQILIDAEAGLVFNIHTITTEITDKIKSTSKNIESILSTNKSGLSLDQALEELEKITVKFADLKFDQLFTYNAVLGKYVYTTLGLQKAIEVERKDLQERVDEADAAIGYYQEIFSASSHQSVGKNNKNELKRWARHRWGDSPITLYYEQLIEAYDPASGKSWNEYLTEAVTTAIQDKEKADAVLKAFNENNKNTLYANIDWAALELGTDYFGTNKVLLEQLAKELKMSGDVTADAVFEEYLRQTYGDEETAAKIAAREAHKNAINSQRVTNLTTAMSEVLNGTVNKYYSAATQQMLIEAGYNTAKLKTDLNASIIAATGLLQTMDKMVAEGAMTVEQYNEQATAILNKVLGTYSRGKTGLDFATGTIDAGALQNLANTLGLKLTDIVDVATGEVRGKLGDVLKYNSLTNSYEIIADTFEEFIQILQDQFGIIIERGSKEYIAALKTFNDNKLKERTSVSDSVTEELEKVMGAKAGDQLNLSYVWSNLSKSTLKELEKLGFNFVDGILTLEENADIPGAIALITSDLQSAGALLPEEIAKLNDTLLNYFQNITNLIKNGIGGTLSYQNKDELQKWFKSVGGEGELDFTRTANGFKLSQKSAEALYDKLVDIDSISAGIVLDELNKSIEESTTNIKALRKEIKELRATTESEDFKFMDKEIPSGQKNPLNYWSNWAQAAELMNESRTTGTMGYEEFYALVTEMGNLAENTENGIKYGEKTLHNAEEARDLIEQAAGALEVQTDGSIKVNLQKIGVDFNLGAEGMTDGIDEGIKKLADDQIKMLDSMIKLMETIVAMEDLGKIDTNGNGIDLSDIIKDGGFTPDYTNWLSDLEAQNEASEGAIQAAMEQVFIGKKNLWDIVHQKVGEWDEQDALLLAAFQKAAQSGDYSTENIIASIKEVLANTNYTGEIHVGKGEDALTLYVDQGVVLERGEEGYKVGNHVYDDPDTAMKATKAESIAVLQGFEKDYKESGAVEYRIREDLAVTIAYDAKTGYSATISAGNNSAKITAETPEELSEGIRQYSLMYDLNLDSAPGESPKDTLTYTIDRGDAVVTMKYNVKTRTAIISDSSGNIGDIKNRTAHLNEQLQEVGDTAEENITVHVDTTEAVNQVKELQKEMHELRKEAALVKIGEYVPDEALETADESAARKRAAGAAAGATGAAVAAAPKTAEIATKIATEIATEITEVTTEIADATAEIATEIAETAAETAAKAVETAAKAVETATANAAVENTTTAVITATNETAVATAVAMAEKQAENVRLGINTAQQIQGFDEEVAISPSAVHGFNIFINGEIAKEGVDSVQDFLQGIIDDGENLLHFNEQQYDLAQVCAEAEAAVQEEQSAIQEASQAAQDNPIEILENGGEETIQTLQEIGIEAQNLDGTEANVTIRETTVKETTEGSRYLTRGYPKRKGSGLDTYDAVHAKGNVALAQGTLMGELGPELVVSNGRYFVAGQNGAEFVDLDTDAIVFNHLQTKSLLSKGMSSSRGKAVTSEKNAVAFAHGNVNGGPAQASARQALAALKQLRAQWQAIKDMSVKDLAGVGGGGGGGGGDKSDPKAFVKELEIWYNWLQRIAVLEQKITYEQQKRQKIQSDMYAHGQDYARSNMETLAYLREQAVVSKSLYDSQQAYFEKRRAEMNAASNPFSALYTFDEYGQLKYQNGAFQQLANISSRDKLTGQGNYTAADQYAKLVSMGFEKYMQYDSSGNKIDTSQEDWQVTAVQAFWDKMDADKEEMQSLHDSIEEHKKAVLEKQEAANQIMREIEDNQISVEDKVLKAIIDIRQREIDELQKQRDAIEEASQNLINGLSEQLNKEKEMYSSQQNQDELSKLQRQLGILQRSGGSASQIANLQREIGQKQQDAYFEAQQKQIDALQEASDNELQRLDNQIELMKETLEYEKENGLLWGQVYEIMAGTPEQITAFIMEHDSEFWGQSPTKDTQTYRETLFEAQQFKEYQAQMKDGFDGLVAAFKDEAIAKAAREEAAKANANTSNGEGVNTGGGSAPSPSGGGDGGGTGGRTGGATDASKNSNFIAALTNVATNGMAALQTNNHAAEVKLEFEGKNTGGIKFGRSKNAKSIEEAKSSAYQAASQKIPYGAAITKTEYTYAYDHGGMVDSTGPALLHAKESVLTPEQTSILRNDILSNKPTSLLSLLTDFRDAYNSIPNASDYNSITNNDGVTIEQAIVEMHVSKIANDYDAQRAGENALEKMVQIARKTQGQRIGR